MKGVAVFNITSHMHLHMTRDCSGEQGMADLGPGREKDARGRTWRCLKMPVWKRLLFRKGSLKLGGGNRRG